jgi:hypothetical protein
MLGTPPTVREAVDAFETGSAEAGQVAYSARTTQRKPRWQVEVSIACAIRAAGR